jgi:phage terminase large subunit
MTCAFCACAGCKNLSTPHHISCSAIRSAAWYESEFTITKTALRLNLVPLSGFWGFSRTSTASNLLRAWTFAGGGSPRHFGEAWETLAPTLRRNGAELWITFNPAFAWDETYVDTSSTQRMTGLLKR